MMIWSGWGFAVALIGFASLVATEYFVERVTQDDQFYQDHGWPKMLGMTVAGLLLWVFCVWLDRTSPASDASTAESPREKLPSATVEHSLFFIPIKYWTPLLLVIGIALSLLG